MILLLVIGSIALQVVLGSQATTEKVGVVGDSAAIGPALLAQGKALDVEVTVVGLPDEAAARSRRGRGERRRRAGRNGGRPALVVKGTPDAPLQAVVQGAVTQVALGQQLAAGRCRRRRGSAGRRAVPGPAGAAEAGTHHRDLIGVAVLYSLLVLFGQFLAQGVVEEKSSRVVELLLATLKPWQLLAGKIVGLGLLGLAQIVVIAGVGVAGALAFDVISLPGQLIGTVVGLVAWFVLGYALYAAVFAAGRRWSAGRRTSPP